MTQFVSNMWYVLSKIFNNQKVWGIILIFSGAMTAIIDSEPGVHDVSAFICVFLPLGLLCLFSRIDLLNYKDER